MGKTDDIQNGSYLYFHDPVANEVIDSAIVENGSFKFDTDLVNIPTWVILTTKDRSNFFAIWLEDQPMTFDDRNVFFKEAKVSGSATQNLKKKIKNAVNTLKRSELDEMFQKVVRNHPDNYYSAFVLMNHSSTWSRDTSLKLYENFSPKVKASQFGEMVSKYLEENISPQLGDHFVNFSMANPRGNLKKLSDLKGKVILLEFWASWCKPCREENPNLVRTYEKYNPLGFEIFAVSLDENENFWKEAIIEDGLNWHHVSDLKGRENKAVKLYGVKGIPDNLLIDREGIIVGRNLRGDELDQVLSELLFTP